MAVGSPRAFSRASAAAAAAASVDAANEAAIDGVRRAVADAFSSQGAFAGAIDGFVARDSQRDLALAVFDAIVERGTLIAEAGTGTGKTFAYLAPALLAGGKVLVSTGTKALQDQIFHKDLPAVRKALGLDLELALLKGRDNYVCLQRLARAESEAMLPTRADVHYLRAITRFARLSTSGDRAELSDVPENASVWPHVTSTRENCLGQQCPRFDECFVYKARRKALAADVVVVNHHLFLADLSLRDDAIREFLPSADTVVLDEAHQLPRIASDFFGTGWSLAQVLDLAADAKALGLSRAADAADWAVRCQAVEQAVRNLRLTIAEAGVVVGQRMAIDRLRARATVANAVRTLGDRLQALAAALRGAEGRDPELDALLPRADALIAEITSWTIAIADDGEAGADDDLVRWISASNHGAQFHATPLAPGEAFARLREQQPQAWILTSATLTMAGRFEAFQQEVGLLAARTARWDSPFDFGAQALLYLPEAMPSPEASDFPEQVAATAWPLIEASGGRAFVLCATLRAVQRVAAALRQRIEDSGLELPLLEQGTSTRRALIDAFRRAGNAVLVGSVSFWEGIDVRGEALSLVVIDKLPFAPPDDPVVEARSRRLKAMGRNPFTEYQLPQAVTLLKQGVGRLIRDEHDRGVLTLLDARLLTKSYGKTVLASLPPFSRTRSLAQACDFLRRPGESD